MRPFLGDLPDRPSEAIPYAEQVWDPTYRALPTAQGIAAMEAGEKSTAKRIRLHKL